MPILPPEPMCFPDELMGEWDDPVSRSWWVLHTRPRQEKSLARHLREHRVPYFLPLSRKRLVVRGVPRHSHPPLFDGYLFLRATEDERLVALSSKRVVRTLVVVEQERLLDDLRQIHRLLAAGRPVTAERRLAAGTPVEICGGPLAGLHGSVLRAASGDRFVVCVDFIQQGASVLLDAADLVARPVAS
jgi:transcriptional antiterminator RfaH